MDNLFVGKCDASPDGGQPRPGDIDGDGDIDFTDFSVLAGNFTGTLGPAESAKMRDDGDFTGTIIATFLAHTVPDHEGDLHLEIDLTNQGAMALQPTNATWLGTRSNRPNRKSSPMRMGRLHHFCSIC